MWGHIRKLFDKGSVCVTGQRGSGKDMLLGNVAVRKKQHISNVPYGRGFIPLEFSKLDIGNTNDALISGNVNPYEYPYPEGVDIFISDIGIYFPSQYNDALYRKHGTLPYFAALSRQLGKGTNVHLNTQNLNRCWLAWREQSDMYLRCEWCKVLGRLVIQSVVEYDKYESCLNRVDPFWYPSCPISASREEKRLHRNNKRLALQRFREMHGLVKRHLLLYVNRADYDTYYFKTLLKGENQCSNTAM